MKKFLSLVLALAMTVSLVTISAGAKDFTDADSITYEEAVAVMSEIGIVDGDTAGNFNAANGLTRGAAAKIICNLILGPTTAAELNADTDPYKDVNKNSTFAGYIAYCQKEGIISGYADGTFKPAAPLTGYAFMKMLLGALGYDGSIEGYTGANWSINVAKQAIGIGLNKGLQTEFNGSAYVTREEAMLYAFNTLQATMVNYDTKITTTVNGSEVTVGNSVAKSVEWTGTNNADGNIKTDRLVQFAEKYFTKLILTGDFDVFERPVNVWTYDKTEIGEYLRTDLLVEEYTAEVTGADLYTLLGKSVVDNYDIFVAIDGVEDSTVDGRVFNETSINKNNKKAVGGTGNGVLTQVFQNTDNEQVYISIINTYLAVASGDYDAKKDTAKFTVYSVDEKNAGSGKEFVKDTASTRADRATEVISVSNEDVTVDFVVDEGVYLVQLAKDEIQAVAEAEIVADTELTAFKLNDNVVADTTYKYANTAMYDVETLDNYTSSSTGVQNLKDITYNIYLDPYGYLIGIKKVTNDDNYVFVSGIKVDSSVLSASTGKANVIFTDGTTATVDVNLKDSRKADGTTKYTADIAVLNSWHTYTVSKDGVYTIKEVAAAINPTNKVKVAQYHNDTDREIDKKHPALAGAASGTYSGVFGNDDTIYLVAELDVVSDGADTHAVISGVESVTTGLVNANIKAWNATAVGAKPAYSGTTNKSSGTYTLYKENGYVIAVVVVGEDEAASKNLVYVNSGSVESESYNKTTGEWTWTREVIQDGVAVKLKEVGDNLRYLNGMSQHGWYQVKLNAEGEVIGVLNDSGTNTWSLTTAVGDASPVYGDYVTSIALLNASIVNGKDTVLYTEIFGSALVGTNAPSLKGSTLFVDKLLTQGFFVASDAKVVFIQTNDGKTTTEYLDGAKELEDVIADLNKNSDGTVWYTISAIFNGGAAKTVIVRDQVDATYKAPNQTVPAGISVNLNGAPGATATAVSVSWTGTTAPTEVEILNAIEAEIVKAGYSVHAKNFASSKYTWTVKNAAGFAVGGYEYTTNSAVQTKAIPNTRTAIKEALGTDFAGFDTYASTGLTQTVDGSTVKVSGKVTPIEDTDVATIVSSNYFGAAGWLSGVSTKAAFMTALEGQLGLSTVDIKDVAFFLVYDGDALDYRALFVYKKADGKAYLANGSQTVTYSNVTFDVSGLTW